MVPMWRTCGGIPRIRALDVKTFVWTGWTLSSCLDLNVFAASSFHGSFCPFRFVLDLVRLFQHQRVSWRR